ncbi:hypothetical protein SAMN04487895_101591 [Paenibacillus sophorae]|uniref:Uncharacterized protein n=1 Tax=Paenibacillus sophorae TaxID=1333845 RepID=A0A1H8GQZ8_9BACL|nr:hypothetical protein [Paenibacillus sophorae]QWU14292.1 hypothetical protein KP014_20510 [Paenibacillus sophorae]SEN45698.1 hypothetical protein SAMN04487895_101591 [Paenibacillus sophorae]
MSEDYESKNYILLYVTIYNLYEEDKHEFEAAFLTMEEMLKYQDEHIEKISKSPAYDSDYRWRENVSEKEIQQILTVEQYCMLHQGLNDAINEYVRKIHY